MRTIQPAGRRAGGAAGVTLAEMLVVVAVIGLFALVALPAVANYIRAARVRASSDNLVADLRAARYIAVTNRTTDSVTFDSVSGTYSYTDIHGATVTRRLEQGVSFQTLTNVPVTFALDGSLAGSPPTIVLRGQVSGSVSHQFTITVNATGKVSATFARV